GRSPGSPAAIAFSGSTPPAEAPTTTKLKACSLIPGLSPEAAAGKRLCVGEGPCFAARVMAEGEGELLEALNEMVRDAIARAQAVAERSELVRVASQLVRDPTLLAKRCAWCNRLAFGRRWIPAADLPEFVRPLLENRVSHGICADCMRRLEREGASRPISTEARGGAPPASAAAGESTTSRDPRR